MKKIMTEEHKRKISESIKKNYEKFGTRTAWNKGKETPEKTKEKQRQSKINNPTKYWLGKKRDEKTIKALINGRKKYKNPKGEKHHSWKGGTSGWYRKMAREIMSTKLNRQLKSSEIVHHIDGNYMNNKIKNLVITNRSEHCKIHKDDLMSGRW